MNLIRRIYFRTSWMDHNVRNAISSILMFSDSRKEYWNVERRKYLSRLLNPKGLEELNDYYFNKWS